MSDVFTLKVNRPYKTTVEGTEQTKNRWVQLGTMTKNNGSVEKIQVYKLEKKENNNDAI